MTVQEREAELRSRYKDLTKPEAPLGSTPDSLRAHPGFENITDQILEERATFNLKDHMAKQGLPSSEIYRNTIDLSKMSVEELHGLCEAALNQLSTRRGEENHG